MPTREKPQFLPGGFYQHIYCHQIVRLFQKISESQILYYIALNLSKELKANKTEFRTLTTPGTKMKNSHAEPNADSHNCKKITLKECCFSTSKFITYWSFFHKSTYGRIRNRSSSEEEAGAGKEHRMGATSLHRQHAPSVIVCLPIQLLIGPTIRTSSPRIASGPHIPDKNVTFPQPQKRQLENRENSITGMSLLATARLV